MSMTILPEKNGSVATIRYGMPTTVRLREYAYDAQREFSCREMASELTGDESDSDSAGGTTTANSNIYSYVEGNPISLSDPFGLQTTPPAFYRTAVLPGPPVVPAAVPGASASAASATMATAEVAATSVAAARAFYLPTARVCSQLPNR